MGSVLQAGVPYARMHRPCPTTARGTAATATARVAAATSGPCFIRDSSCRAWKTTVRRAGSIYARSGRSSAQGREGGSSVVAVSPFHGGQQLHGVVADAVLEHEIH